MCFFFVCVCSFEMMSHVSQAGLEISAYLKITLTPISAPQVLSSQTVAPPYLSQDLLLNLKGFTVSICEHVMPKYKVVYVRNVINPVHQVVLRLPNAATL